jgi:hypothetical protein
LPVLAMTRQISDYGPVDAEPAVSLSWEAA